ncbi:hypothetical protein KIH27_12265 [Mycobacterium sp. M1]|uniref:DUF4226 domain-containing protein n=1 Tax=Mycolicibacter acidiphilus TaxID=2835306 RepID=A0ABS5RJH7_9MYCO|nr:hypothetical protein [Mycolicibacter acidiphilus]MBS9534359.1 hypothetical protein [Mycolicibacter acidiphilus]
MAAADELSDPFTAAMIGAWWPAPPAGPASAATHWETQRQLKEDEAGTLDLLRTRLAAENTGVTAEDLLARLHTGRNQLRDIADQCQAKSEGNAAVARAVDGLRERLRGIAANGRQRIADSLAGDDPFAKKVADINNAIRDAHEAAAGASNDAADQITGSTQRVLDQTTGGDARSILREHGADVHPWPRPREFTADDVTRALGGGGFGFPAGGGASGGESGGGFGSFAPPNPLGLVGSPGAWDGGSSAEDPRDTDTEQSTATPDAPDVDDTEPQAAPAPPSPSVTPMAGAAPVNPPARPAPSTTGPQPAGPLPTYGADLRPPVIAPAAPAGPAPGAPVATSPTSPAAPSLAAPVQRRTPPTPRGRPPAPPRAKT